MDNAATASAGSGFGCDCRLNGAEFRDRVAASMQVLHLAQTRQEMHGGYAFEFEASSECLQQLTELIDAERQCCPFLNFVLKVPASQKVLTLEITGPADAKPLIWAELLADESDPPTPCALPGRMVL